MVRVGAKVTRDQRISLIIKFAPMNNPKAMVVSIDPEEPKDLQVLQTFLDEGWKMLSTAATHNRVVYVFLKTNA